MREKLITLDCYRVMKELYIEREYLLYEFPCGIIEGVDFGNGIKMADIAFRKMDVQTPPEIESLWEYDSMYTDNAYQYYWDEDKDLQSIVEKYDETN